MQTHKKTPYTMKNTKNITKTQAQEKILNLFLEQIAKDLNLDQEEKNILFNTYSSLQIPEGESFWWINPDDQTIEQIQTNEKGFSKELFDQYNEYHLIYPDYHSYHKVCYKIY